MAWLEITIDTAAEKISSVVTVLTARGFSDLVIEDQEEFETFLEENRAYWDYTLDLAKIRPAWNMLLICVRIFRKM